jgi:sulfite reductase (NADPH) hemoprotein beta-component
VAPSPSPPAANLDRPASVAADPRRRASFADAAEIAAFLETLGRFERGELDAEAWRAYRVARGAYGQRQDGVHMLRIKLPQGAVTAEQLRALADAAARFSRGFGHLTTRQNFQLGFVRPADLEPAMARLAAAGITTSGSGGNTVRNVVACPHAGVSPDELFDPTPYAEAVTRHFLRHPLGHALPRKLKIAFEGCALDHVATAIQDLGFTARVRTHGARAARGFLVTVAGGTSSLCTSGSPIVEFLPASEVLAFAEAVVRVFHARGDRVNKQRNRLKFLVRALGFEAFRALVLAELERVRAEGAPALPFDPEAPPAEAPPALARPLPREPAAIAEAVRAAPVRGPGEPPPLELAAEPGTGAYETFRATNVAPQRQVGFVTVTVSFPQGDVRAGQLEALAHLAEAYGDGAVRFGSGGRVLLRWIREADAPPLFARLAAAGLGRDGARSAADVVACPGSEVCRLAVTRTREVSRLVEAGVRAHLGAAALAAPLAVHVSGCPNGCSQHHLAAIGLQGSVRRVGGRPAPQFFVLVGGHAAAGAEFGRLAGKVPVRRIPQAVTALVDLYLRERSNGEAAGPFFSRSLGRAREVLAPLEELRPEDARPEDFVEPGTNQPFQPETQAGECAA